MSAATPCGRRVPARPAGDTNASRRPKRAGLPMAHGCLSRGSTGCRTRGRPSWRVPECIEMAKGGRLADATRLFDEVLDGLPDAWPPLLACTELSLIRPLSRHRRPSVDSTQVLAAECVRRLRLCRRGRVNA